MILADTAVWIDFLDHGDAEFQRLLEQRIVVMHPYVVGEVAMGNLRHRARAMRLLSDFPLAIVARDDAVISFVEKHQIYGRGIGYVDAHLLLSAHLTPDTKIWTFDKRLATVASELSLSADQ